MVPVFWMWVGQFRRYGRKLSEYLKHMLEICRCHGACFSDVGEKISWVRETIKKISGECVGNVPMSWCLFFGCGWENLVGTGDN